MVLETRSAPEEERRALRARPQTDAPFALVRTYAELARGGRPNGEEDQSTTRTDDLDGHHAMTAAMDEEQTTRTREPLFKVSNISPMAASGLALTAGAQVAAASTVL
jgi:hypothetical protein